MFINCLRFIEQAWETVFKPFTMKICEVIWKFTNYLWKTGSWKRDHSFFAEFIINRMGCLIFTGQYTAGFYSNMDTALWSNCGCYIYHMRMKFKTSHRQGTLFMLLCHISLERARAKEYYGPIGLKSHRCAFLLHKNTKGMHEHIGKHVNCNA